MADFKQIHIKLPEQIHKYLRIKTAKEDTTIQEYVADLIQQNLLTDKAIQKIMEAESGDRKDAK